MEAAQKVQESLDSSTASGEDSNEDTSQRRQRVKTLFYAMDKDGNGKLDVGEFRGASPTLKNLLGWQSCLASNPQVPAAH